ncbi:1-acyl-sn-glycerol-3-phosphate acyltransferase [Microvirga sp. ACRRW]|uniref:lysophospholipid acyltransferase family protein n=1 Tax=Microvirga sp. ACRRW TaxID=2918205 RepID=UPI001EF539E6|nr:lysophospholipid acyltransferase family protein [Microvirga sp. ACRRW]MCG7392351.1 1-acyl-sn-glycerol-3-phosphate acyltransferase [Microvirga sp. ACRRW]
MIDLVLIGLTRFLVGGHARWIGTRPDEKQRIYFANHGSHIDTLLLWSALPKTLRATTHPAAAADYWGQGTIKRLIAQKGLNAVLINRSGSSAPGEALEPLRKVLSEGHSLILFPEGTRSANRLPGPFKSGLYRLAKEFPNAELIPVYLDNPARAMPKGAMLPLPIICSAHFGAPLAPIENEEKEQFLQRAQAAVSALAPPASEVMA